MNAGFRADVNAYPPSSWPPEMDRSRASAMLGRVLAKRWTVSSTLGVGGTSTVYEAVHRNGRRVAVKVLHSNLADHRSVRRRFLSEGYAANRVRHPDAVGILDDGEEADGTAFLVMELLRGQSFAALLRERGPLPVSDVVSVALAVLDVLAAAHENGVVHRDIKPGNIFLTDEGRIKLLDFGVALVADSSSVTTGSGVTVGTPAFMAPEQAAGRFAEIDAITDLWAVGATMFQLLTGRLVHEADTGSSALVAAATRPAPSIASAAPHLPPTIAAVVDRALKFERSERWPNARAMHRALQLVGGQRSSLAPRENGTETAPEVASPTVFNAEGWKARRWRGRLLLVSIAVTALVACGIWVAHDGTRASASAPTRLPGHAVPVSTLMAVASAASAAALPPPTRSAEAASAAPVPITSSPQETTMVRTNRTLKAALPRVPVADSESALLDRRK